MAIFLAIYSLLFVIFVWMIATLLIDVFAFLSVAVIAIKNNQEKKDL